MTVIAYLTSEYPAASHTFIRREIAALRKKGLTIRPLSIRPGSIRIDEEVPSILGRGRLSCVISALRTIMKLPARSLAIWGLAQHHRTPGARGWLWAQFHWVEALALVTMLRRLGAERLHSHFANSGATVGMLAAHCLRIPWSVTLHGISETDAPAGALLGEKLKRADFVACASWFMRAQAMRVTPTDHWPKYHVVRCGVELREMTQPSAQEHGRKKPRFITVGRLSPEKGYPGLIRAFSALVEQGIDGSLTIVGDGPLRGALEREVQSKGLQDRVKMKGALEEAETLDEIAKADLFVLPSLMEGLPVVLMEAMALGKPVVAPAVAGIPELVSHGSTGFLFRPGDWDQLAERMVYLAHDEATCRRLAQAALASIEREFEIERAVVPLAALLERSSPTDRSSTSIAAPLPTRPLQGWETRAPARAKERF